ncbi:uncharacterized protein LOC126790411 isoform X1 [Argentina anserina]|uniref:uncharacterized protein LOC126790411 isoform X1 n=1 Tax=Argentina anserina TaxID=57926 RepID=UPI0021765152|nr:uncharacterized protein LOC126790411 isoform X1 [Potentilla anserina]
MQAGVLTERCYGCGHCIPVCPFDKISVSTYIRDAIATSELLKRNDVDAIEIHTSGRQIAPFKELWDGLGDSIKHLRLAAVSLPDLGESSVSTMKAMYSIMEPDLGCFNLWQVCFLFTNMYGLSIITRYNQTKVILFCVILPL